MFYLKVTLSVLVKQPDSNGFQVFEARTGQEGIDLALKEKPDIIIVDIQLPDINGLEVTRTIRQSEALADVPIVAFTSFAMAGDRQRALEAGCTGYIEKPVDPEKLLNQIKTL